MVRLSKEQVQSYKDDGFVLVKGLIDPAFCERLREDADYVLNLANSQGDDINVLWKGNFTSDEDRARQRINGVHDVHFHSAVFSRLAMHDPMLDVVEQLIGPDIHLHHTKLFLKPAREGGSFPMHQDHPYFPHALHTMMAAIVHITGATEEMGCVRVVPGSHKKGPMECEPGHFYLPTADWPVNQAQPCPAEAGDVLFFNYLTVHGSGPNVSDNPRYTVLYQMRAANDEPTVKTHVSRGQGMMLRGRNPKYLPPVWGEEKAANPAVASRG